jgi:penicillin amidase
MTRRLTAIGATALAAIGCAVLPAGAATGHGTRTGPAPQRVGSGAETAQIVRDSYGVPSVYSRTSGGMWFGDGWAQAQDRLVQLELTRRAVEGTLSGIFGSSQLGQDETARTFFYTPAEVRRQYRSMPAADRNALEAFSTGINAYEDYAYADPASRVPYEFFVLGQLLGLPDGTPYRPAPWTPEDTVAVGNYLAREFGGGGGSELQNLQFLDYLVGEQTAKGDVNAVTDATAIFNDARWLNDPTAPTTVPAAVTPSSSAARPDSASTGDSASSIATAKTLASLHMLTPSAIAAAASRLAADRKSILATGISLRVLSHGGSNAIAVAPWRSADHHALIWGAPQEGFGTPSVDWEVYLHGPGGYDAGGMAITGEPFVLIGRNADIAWTTTSEETVDQRIYVEQVNFADNPPRYLWDGKWIAMQAITEPIPVAGQSAPQLFTVYRTKDGPVFSTDPSDGVAFSMRFASWGRETGSLEGFAQLGGDTDLSQFRHSMSLVTTLHNFLYADNRGNIAYFGDGLVPIEPSFSKVDPRLPALGNGTEQWRGYVPFADMPRSVNPAQGYLDNWNTKPSASAYYQQNGGDEYWGTIFRSSLISKMVAASRHITIGYLENIEHAIGTIDNQDNTRPAAPYFIPFVVRAYDRLRQEHSPLASPATHPDLAAAVSALKRWNGVTTIGSPAMSIFMNFLEAFERNVLEGGLNSGEQYTGKVNFDDTALVGDSDPFGGLGNMGTYNLLYHILAHTKGIDPCGTLCYQGGYFAGHEYQVLVESLNDAITILSGTGTQLGQRVAGFGTTDIAKWGYAPAQDQNWDSLDPLAVGVTTTCGTSASQNRSTFMMAVDVGRHAVTGRDELPPGESAFISAAGIPSPHLCDQVGLFDTFRYKTMPRA